MLYGANYFYGHDRPYKYGDSVRNEYRNWSEDQRTDMQIGDPAHNLRARHNRGAPLVHGLGSKPPPYSGLFKAVKGAEDDRSVARRLLEGTAHGLATLDQRSTAIMMEAIVGLAEQWRKKGAPWIFRADLRMVEAGKIDLEAIPTYFKFVSSAKEGRQQVGRLRAVREGRLQFGQLPAADQALFPYLSDDDSDDLQYESDEEIEAAHHMKGQRHFYT
ncbi:hypothetical protein [Engelhardtia mirabilis]|uniref:hypothetical protein n=1 Tax=Engelhardtia mirabilis TaxID=2528011 RepID=UPI003AF3C9DA